MILIDRREGSKELADLIPDSVLVELDFGDIAFEGNGPDGKVQVGIERKRIGDLVNSISTGRLSGHQIPGMLQAYYRSYLIVEGVWRGSEGTGELQTTRGGEWRRLNRGRRTFSAEGVMSYLSSMEIMVGMIVKETRTVQETVRYIENRYKWWNKKWEGHKSHLAMYKPPPIAGWLNPERPSLMRRIASELPHIGVMRSIEVEKHFKSVEEMMGAWEEDWMEIEGVGNVTAREIVKAIKERRR